MNSAFSESNIVRVVQKAAEEHGRSREALVPILSEVNRVFGFIPTEAIPEIRRQINNPDKGVFLADSHLFSVASFYQMLSLRTAWQACYPFLCQRALPCSWRTAGSASGERCVGNRLWRDNCGS